MQNDKALHNAGRKSYDFRVERDHKIIAVKWYDSKTVQLMSTLHGIKPAEQCKRWNPTTKQYVNIIQPAIVREHNRNMGGVD